MNPPLASVAASPLEVAAPLPGDQVVPVANVVMDRGFDLAAPPAEVWPWLVQLGKRRSGWYLPRGVERLVPPARRAVRGVGPGWQGLVVGDVVPDWGGKHASFEVVEIAPPHHLVYRSQRGRTALTWVIALRATGEAGTRVHLRLRLAPVRRTRLAHVVGGFFDAVTVAGLAAGLRERLEDDARRPG